MKYTLEQKQPYPNQFIVFQLKDEIYPEAGIWHFYKEHNNYAEVYMYAIDDVIDAKYIEWWSPVYPDKEDLSNLASSLEEKYYCSLDKSYSKCQEHQNHFVGCFNCEYYKRKKGV